MFICTCKYTKKYKILIYNTIRLKSVIDNFICKEIFFYLKKNKTDITKTI